MWGPRTEDWGGVKAPQINHRVIECKIIGVLGGFWWVGIYYLSVSSFPFFFFILFFFLFPHTFSLSPTFSLRTLAFISSDSLSVFFSEFSNIYIFDLFVCFGFGHCLMACQEWLICMYALIINLIGGVGQVV